MVIISEFELRMNEVFGNCKADTNQCCILIKYFLLCVWVMGNTSKKVKNHWAGDFDNPEHHFVPTPPAYGRSFTSIMVYLLLNIQY